MFHSVHAWDRSVHIILCFFPDWIPQPTSAVPFPTSSSFLSPENTQHTQGPLQNTSTTTAQPGNSCFQNITVVYPRSGFCTNKKDGLYLKSDNPRTFFKCVQSKTYITKCHTVETERNKGVQLMPSGSLALISFAIATLLNVFYVWGKLIDWMILLNMDIFSNTSTMFAGLLWKNWDITIEIHFLNIYCISALYF